ncbi:hypothetical protein ALC57_12294 [Trachymyrmex cornetzi]|uniref:Uncharacterized protein n=1 Tax=Trachymyrmex cornetzi TaxID=471704 RepID=A0A151J137_9HYME|nr:hypothetical protein ALC57_12294 [Trachymyrmex cornetzi]
MLTCLIAILMLFVSLKTLVKREPLNIASLDAGYKSISVTINQNCLNRSDNTKNFTSSNIKNKFVARSCSPCNPIRSSH